MTNKDRIEAAIRHIQTAVDIDPWAMELAVDALKAQMVKSDDLRAESAQNVQNGDLISRKLAIDALGEEPEVWSGKDEYAQGLNNQWHSDVSALRALPSAQPDDTFKRKLMMYLADLQLTYSPGWGSNGQGDVELYEFVTGLIEEIERWGEQNESD